MDECKHWMPLAWCAICNGDDVASVSGPSRIRMDEDDKQVLVTAICTAADLPRRTVSTGSSVPSALFNNLADKFGVSKQGGMAERARRIVESVGVTWTAECDSSGTLSGGGGTVTARGLRTILTAVEVLNEQASV